MKSHSVKVHGLSPVAVLGPGSCSGPSDVASVFSGTSVYL